MPTVCKNDLEHAFEWVTAGALEFGAAAYISRETGDIYWTCDDEGMLEEQPPADIDDDDKYVAIPDKPELDLGTTLVFDFVREQIPQHEDRVSDIFRSRGAYRRFKEFLDDHGHLQAWYTYSQAQETKALAAWCKEEGLELDEDT